jgi:hypothetical protein
MFFSLLHNSKSIIILSLGRHSSLKLTLINYGCKKLITLSQGGVNDIKLYLSVMYSFLY